MMCFMKAFFDCIRKSITEILLWQNEPVVQTDVSVFWWVCICVSVSSWLPETDEWLHWCCLCWCEFVFSAPPGPRAACTLLREEFNKIKLFGNKYNMLKWKCILPYEQLHICATKSTNRVLLSGSRFWLIWWSKLDLTADTRTCGQSQMTDLTAAWKINETFGVAGCLNQGDKESASFDYRLKTTVLQFWASQHHSGGNGCEQNSLESVSLW